MHLYNTFLSLTVPKALYNVASVMAEVVMQGADPLITSRDTRWSSGTLQGSSEEPEVQPGTLQVLEGHSVLSHAAHRFYILILFQLAKHVKHFCFHKRVVSEDDDGMMKGYKTHEPVFAIIYCVTDSTDKRSWLLFTACSAACLPCSESSVITTKHQLRLMVMLLDT